MIVWFLISGKYRVRRYKIYQHKDGGKREIELLKICESAYTNDNAWRDDRLPQNLEVSIGKWYIVVRTPLASIPREVVEWARVHLSCLSHSFRPDYIRVSTRVYLYTSAFAFTYWKNVYPLHARISFELILRILLFSMSSSTFYACN